MYGGGFYGNIAIGIVLPFHHLILRMNVKIFVMMLFYEVISKVNILPGTFRPRVHNDL